MTTQTLEILSGLEKNLERSLRPVQPNQEFVHRLRSRLVNPQTTILERYASNSLGAPVLFLVGFGLAVGVFLVWAVRQVHGSGSALNP